MKKLDINLENQSYTIEIGSGLLKEAGTHLRPFIKRNICPVVTDETVYALHGQTLSDALKEVDIHPEFIVLKQGEGTKSFDNLQKVLDRLFDLKIERQDTLIAFGGGVIGDLAGFAASVFRRGIPFIQIPTTLLAQVDSSVGGKTGINVSYGKNLVGTFYQPVYVLTDVDILKTLPKREFLAGYAEVVKYGLLGNKDFFQWLDKNLELLLEADNQVQSQAILQCCQDKATIVQKDTFESGCRALLNLGHTFGHALEAATGYGSKLLHGEGVSVGIVLAFKLSHKMGLCEQEDVERVIEHFKRSGMRAFLSEISSDLPATSEIIRLMYQDKKVSSGTIKFILTRGIGEAFISDAVDMQVVQELLDEERELLTHLQ